MRILPAQLSNTHEIYSPGSNDFMTHTEWHFAGKSLSTTNAVQSDAARTVSARVGFGIARDLLRTTTDVQCTLSNAYGGVSIALQLTGPGQNSTEHTVYVGQHA